MPGYPDAPTASITIGMSKNMLAKMLYHYANHSQPPDIVVFRTFVGRKGRSDEVGYCFGFSNHYAKNATGKWELFRYYYFSDPTERQKFIENPVIDEERQKFIENPVIDEE